MGGVVITTHITASILFHTQQYRSQPWCKIVAQTFQGVIRDTVIDKYSREGGEGYNPSPNRNTSMTAYNRT